MEPSLALEASLLDLLGVPDLDLLRISASLAGDLEPLFLPPDLDLDLALLGLPDLDLERDLLRERDLLLPLRLQ